LGNRILVLNGMSYAAALRDIGDVTYQVSDLYRRPQDFCLVLFTGGEDVSPSFYGESSPKGQCWHNIRRDEMEKQVFEFANLNNIPMAGICRGIQFLNVMAGGRLMHHISGHGGSTHYMRLSTGQEIRVNSLHHQMVIPHKRAEIIGVSRERLSNIYVSIADEPIEYMGAEVEAAIFPEINAFGVQYHPEMMDERSEGYDFFHRMVKNALSLDWQTFITAYTEGLDNVKLVEVHDAYGAAGR
jgi:putative glutamine amidotransferase